MGPEAGVSRRKGALEPAFGEMLVPEFCDILAVVGWRGRDLALRVGVSEKQVSLWRRGKVGVPGAVAAYLRLRVAVGEFVSNVDV